MAKKGLDTTFLHYGIRKEDMSFIETLCVQHGLDFDWLRDDILKQFHDKKNMNQELEEKSIEKIIEKIIDKALQKIK
jgi:hypothetical protein